MTTTHGAPCARSPAAKASWLAFPVVLQCLLRSEKRGHLDRAKQWSPFCAIPEKDTSLSAHISRTYWRLHHGAHKRQSCDRGSRWLGRTGSDRVGTCGRRYTSSHRRRHRRPFEPSSTDSFSPSRRRPVQTRGGERCLESRGGTPG